MSVRSQMLGHGVQSLHYSRLALLIRCPENSGRRGALTRYRRGGGLGILKRDDWLLGCHAACLSCIRGHGSSAGYGHDAAINLKGAAF